MTDNRNQMKRLLLILLASGIVIAGAAQTLTQNYMQQLPALPRDSCNISRNSAEAFESRVDALKEKLDQEIESIKEAVDTHMESNAVRHRKT
jgi:ABC-type Zn uptake system ZnuABC Zn-binding protein ZnuA